MSDQTTKAEAELVEWARVTRDRDNRIRRALVAGITKHRIHTLTGISRATIDRIVRTDLPQMQGARMEIAMSESDTAWHRSQRATLDKMQASAATLPSTIGGMLGRKIDGYRKLVADLDGAPRAGSSHHTTAKLINELAAELDTLVREG